MQEAGTPVAGHPASTILATGQVNIFPRRAFSWNNLSSSLTTTATSQSFFHREDIFPPEQADLSYQNEKMTTHHLLLYVLQAQPQVLSLRPSLAIDQHLYGKVLTHKHRGVFWEKESYFLLGNQ